MPDISVRGFSEDEYASLKHKASESGKSLEAWAKATLIAASQEPTVKSRYILRAFGPGPAYVEIRRTEDSLSDPRPFLHGKSVEQISSIEQALQFVKRNGPGDRECSDRCTL